MTLDELHNRLLFPELKTKKELLCHQHMNHNLLISAKFTIGDLKVSMDKVVFIHLGIRDCNEINKMPN